MNGAVPFEPLIPGLHAVERTDPEVWDEWDRLTGGTVKAAPPCPPLLRVPGLPEAGVMS